MSYEKNIVCLAKSVKHGGYCIAGKEQVSSEDRGWVRPVSERDGEEISATECRYADGEEPRVLDVITVPLLEPKPHAYQKENHLIDPGGRWVNKGRKTWEDVELLVDSTNATLWVNGFSSKYGVNDQVPEKIAAQLDSSLLLIRPRDLIICVEREGFLFPKRKVRAAFSHNDHQYKLMVTDPFIKDRFWSQLGQHQLGSNVLLCVSLGEVFKGNAYKLVAAVIMPGTAR